MGRDYQNHKLENSSQMKEKRQKWKRKKKKRSSKEVLEVKKNHEDTLDNERYDPLAKKETSKKPLKRLKQEKEKNEYSEDENVRDDLIYGIHPVEELILHRASEIEELIVLEKGNAQLIRLTKEASKTGILVRYRPRSFFDRLLPEKNHQGILVRVQTFVYADFDELISVLDQGAILFLVGVLDPGNLGSLVRSARAFGARGVVIGEREGCAVTPTVIRSSAGAANLLPIAKVRNFTLAIKQMKEKGWWLLGLAPQKEMLHQFDLQRPTVFLLGEEGRGLKPSIKKHCDALLGIPMAEDWDSLNVAHSGSIALYEWKRQQF